MTADQRQSVAPSQDCLTPAQIEEKAEKAGIAKANMPTLPCFLLSIAAGAFIGLGGMYFTIVISDPDLSFATQKVVGGLAFCLGLALVLIAGAELFTGNALMVISRVAGQISTGQMIRNWTTVWLGNLVGALGLIFLAYMAKVYAMGDGAVAATMLKIAVGKVTLDPTTLFFKAILCNLMVCLAVWLGYAGRSVTDKIVAILLPISGFVAAGFEHCVANMYFLPFALLLKWTGHVPAGLDVSALTTGGVIYNIVVATIGNIIGGGLFVGFLYWLIYRVGFGKPASILAGPLRETSAPVAE